MKLSDTVERKFVESFDVSEWEVLTEDGFKDISTSNKTVEYERYTIILENGMSIDCADDHIFITSAGEEVFAKNALNMVLHTIEGPMTVIHVQASGEFCCMYDFSVDSETHTYYTNGILSHNTTCVAAWLLWYALFKQDQSIAILANKGAQAREILSRVTLALENLPFFLQAGCKELNKGSITWENNSKIFCAATTGSSIRGKACVSGDTLVTVRDAGVSETIRIDSVKWTPSMEVLTHSGFKKFKAVLNQGIKDTLLIQFTDGSSISCTPDHRFLCAGAFVEAGDLSEGDLLSAKTVKRIYKSSPQLVYDLENVEETNSYITSGVISHNCTVVYLDEFAFVDNADEFYESTYPVVTSGKTTKVIITSTPRGAGNLFHRLWEGAVQKTNEYAPIRVRWDDVPDRGEDFKKSILANMTEKQWRQEYLCEFLGSTSTLLESEALLSLMAKKPIEESLNNCFKIYEKPVEKHVYVATVDCAKGRGKDYSVVNVFDVSVTPFKQVAIYRSNTISPLIFPDIILKICNTYNQAIAVVENNMCDTVVNTLYSVLEYENVYVETSKGGGVGLNMSAKVKRIGCSNLKDLIEKNKITLVDADTIKELSSFEASGDSYAGVRGNDDTVMTLVIFAYFIQTAAFVDMTDIDIRSLLFAEQIADLTGREDDMMPTVGYFDDGRGVVDMARHSQSAEDAWF